LGLPNLAAKFQSVLAWDHNVQDKECRTLPLGFRDYSVPGGEQFNRKSRTFKVMAHKPGNIRVILYHVYVWFHEDIVAVTSS
jgi:hypothetical protein